MLESQIQTQLLNRLGSQQHIRLFRNSVGVASIGNPPRKLRFGLHPGSSDLIGWKSLIITPDMVGRRIAVFLSIEVKRPGQKPKPHQKAWLDAVNHHGGIAIVATDPEIHL